MSKQVNEGEEERSRGERSRGVEFCMYDVCMHGLFCGLLVVYFYIYRYIVCKPQFLPEKAPF